MSSTRSSSASRRLAAGFALGAALVALAGCGSLDTSKGEQAIRSEIERDTGARAVKVDCPDDVEQKKGENFDCSATVDGQRINVPVVQKDDEGNVEFTPELVPTEEARAAAEAAASRRTATRGQARASCPVAVPLKKGSSFTCDVQTPGPSFKASFTQVDDAGRLSPPKLEPTN